MNSRASGWAVRFCVRAAKCAARMRTPSIFWIQCPCFLEFTGRIALRIVIIKKFPAESSWIGSYGTYRLRWQLSDDRSCAEDLP